ncbi:ABC-type sugar transport system periplasmic component-like protein [Mesorhizobium plurifarium]|uniref:ABC-type sugar transport system periplasmic component-like protein n=1 Tax=Mesorhizobium plurifarium TaxID=69974 RepID=A0A0K2VPN5_MESPL|nr:ABC-type sugar transport system periplasmic component-like protein [Mesorhizobium plurifarium]
MQSRSLCAGLMALAGFAVCVGATSGHAEAKKTYAIYLSNNFVGNDWRQQMERVANVAVNKGPLKGRVDLKIENAENTVQAQINSLNNIIRQKPDAILIDASSAEALNPTIKKACDAGIVVVSFDQTVSAECAYKLHSDFDIMANNQAEWMASMLGGKGKVFMDRGLAGAPISEQFEKNFGAVLKKYPGIEIVGYFNGNYAAGPEQEGVASLLAAHPEVDGIFSQGYGTGAIKALQNADRPMVPVVAAAFNGTGVTCAETKGAKCWLGANPPSLSAEAIKLAVDILDTGTKPADTTVLFNSPGLTTDMVAAKYAPNSSAVKIELGKTVFPDLAPGLSLPVSPSWVEITPKEASGS